MIQHPGKTDVGEIRDRILDKGIVLDASARLSRIELTIESRVVVSDSSDRAPAASAAGAGERPALRIVQKAFDAWNDHDVERYTALLDEGYVGETHHTASVLRGPEDARRAMKSCLDTLPDLRFTIESALTVGDDVLVSWRALPWQVPGCTVTRLRGRKIAHTWTYWDAPNGLQPNAPAPR
jgi:ketosteroid isomerase-like protein